jgi:hypothetical protein
MLDPAQAEVRSASNEAHRVDIGGMRDRHLKFVRRPNNGKAELGIMRGGPTAAASIELTAAQLDEVARTAMAFADEIRADAARWREQHAA